MSSPRVSVVTPTFNRKDRLERVLDALRTQDVSPELFEQVIVDDGSSDGTGDWLKRQSLPFAIHVETQENSGPAAARNRGVKAARGEIILFLDDDVVPVPELIGEHLKVHQAESGDVVVLGTLSSLPYYPQPWIHWEQVQIEKQYRAMIRGDYAPSYRQFWTGNASVSRARLLEAGLFDTSFKRGEDVELGRRLAALGVDYRFQPNAIGYHHAERSLDSFCHAHESYGRLEVEIFSDTPLGDLKGILAGNLRRLHPAQRRVVLAATGSDLAYRALRQSLRSALSLGVAKKKPEKVERLVSLLANLLYWRACRVELGEARFAEVVAQSEQQAARHS